MRPRVLVVSHGPHCLDGVTAAAAVARYYGDGADLASTELLARRIGEIAGGAEVEVVHGGQPHYRYLISAE